jgi:hypothetical protein
MGRPESLAQCSRKRRRCQRRTVSGVTITSDCRHPAQTLASPTHSRRSVVRSVAASLFAVDGKLVAQGQVLDGELAMAAEEEGKESKKVE